MNIQKIKIENFKSIYEPLELDFNDIKGFWKISGSVGAGKTTIGEAIIFGLFGTVGGKNNSDLISWGKKHGLIEIWLTTKGRNLYIKRELNAYGQSPIYVEVDGEELVFTNKRDAQVQLEKEYYDTSKVTMELLCIISFNNFKSLATLNAQDTKKFLDQVLGFYTLTEYSEVCKSFRTNVQNEIRGIQSEIHRTQGQIEKLEEIANMDLIEGDMDIISNEIKKLNEEIVNISNSYSEKIQNINNDITGKKSELASLTTLGKNKAKEIAFIEKGKCPTCGAPIDQSQLETKKEERKVLLESYNRINSDITNLTNEISKINEEMIKYISPKKELVKSQENKFIRLKEQAKRSLINTKEIDKLKNNIIQLEANLNSYMNEDTQWEQLYNILSVDIRTKILESFIPILNQNILKYTQRLQQPYIVTFDSNFKCSINVCGYDNNIPISSLSTGQLKTVDMIIILGVLGTIIGSSSTNIMFLDELFSNLDVNLRNEMCQVLKEATPKDNTMFIISHQDLDEQYFNGYIHMKLEQVGQYEKRSKAIIKKL